MTGSATLAAASPSLSFLVPRSGSHLPGTSHLLNSTYCSVGSCGIECLSRLACTHQSLSMGSSPALCWSSVSKVWIEVDVRVRSVASSSASVQVAEFFDPVGNARVLEERVRAAFIQNTRCTFPPSRLSSLSVQGMSLLDWITEAVGEHGFYLQPNREPPLMRKYLSTLKSAVCSWPRTRSERIAAFLDASWTEEVLTALSRHLAPNAKKTDITSAAMRSCGCVRVQRACTKLPPPMSSSGGMFRILRATE